MKSSRRKVLLKLLSIVILGFNVISYHKAFAVPLTSIVSDIKNSNNSNNIINYDNLAEIKNFDENKKLSKKLIDMYRKRLEYWVYIQNYEEGQLERKLDFKNLSGDAEKLYQNLKKFVKDSDDRGCSAENFNDYVNRFLSEGYMTSLSKEEFDKFLQKPYTQRLYRGVRDLLWAEDFRKGRPYIGGNIRGFYDARDTGSLYGHCIYTSNDLKVADTYTSKKIEFEKANYLSSCDHHRIIEMAFDRSEVKIIDITKLKEILEIMLYNHPESFPQMVISEVCLLGDSHNVGSAHFDLYAQAFEETFNYSLFELVKKVDPNYLEKQSTDEILNTQFLVGEVMIAAQRDPKFSERYNELMEKSKMKPHFKNKFCAAAADIGLLARLLGYDIIVENQMYNKKTNNEEVCYFGVVNPSILRVCDSIEKEEKVTLEKSFDMSGGL